MLLLVAAAAAAVTIHADFESASLGRVELVARDHYRCHVAGQSDQDNRNRQASWYYFRVDGARGRTVTFDMVDLAGEYNYQPNRGAIIAGTLPFYSYDQRSWRPVEEGSYDAVEPKLSFKVPIAADRVWIAHVPPYTLRNLAELLEPLASRPEVMLATIGKSVEGRPIPLVTITDPAVPDDAKKVVWLMFRQHAWESGSSWTADGLVRWVTSALPAAARIRREVILKIYPMCDPDGVAHGAVRFNRNGYDLNRNWDRVDPARMPEIAAQRQAILEWVDGGKRLDFFLTLHNDENSEYLSGPPGQSVRLRRLLDAVFAAWSAGRTFAPTTLARFMESNTTAGRAGRMNVVQGLYHDRQLPAFEVEMRITRHPKLGGRPNIEDRKRAGEELIQAIGKALTAAE
jgi:murein tripeptide amidase MpaA